MRPPSNNSVSSEKRVTRSLSKEPLNKTKVISPRFGSKIGIDDHFDPEAQVSDVNDTEVYPENKPALSPVSPAFFTPPVKSSSGLASPTSFVNSNQVHHPLSGGELTSLLMMFSLIYLPRYYCLDLLLFLKMMMNGKD